MGRLGDQRFAGQHDAERRRERLDTLDTYQSRARTAAPLPLDVQLAAGRAHLQETHVVAVEELPDVPQTLLERGIERLPHEVARDRGEQSFETQSVLKLRLSRAALVEQAGHAHQRNAHDDEIHLHGHEALGRRQDAERTVTELGLVARGESSRKQCGAHGAYAEPRGRPEIERQQQHGRRRWDSGHVHAAAEHPRSRSDDARCEQAGFERPPPARPAYAADDCRDAEHGDRNHAELGQYVGISAHAPSAPVRQALKGVDDRGIGERRQDRCSEPCHADEGDHSPKRIELDRRAAQEAEPARRDQSFERVGDEQQRHDIRREARVELEQHVHGQRAREAQPPVANRQQQQRGGENRIRRPQNRRRRCGREGETDPDLSAEVVGKRHRHRDKSQLRGSLVGGKKRHQSKITRCHEPPEVH